MKVLYLGHYKESSGWANVTVDQILALDAVGVDVVCRNVTLTQDKTNVHPRILELEEKSTEGCTHCIQHLLPHHLVGTDGFEKNIAFVELESTSIEHISWIDNLMAMDEVWVPNTDLAVSLESDGINYDNLRVVHHPCDAQKFRRRYPPVQIPQAENKFRFYYIGDLNDRKAINTMLRCYHAEFNPSEATSLVLKVRKWGHSPEQVKQLTDARINEVKTKLRMYPDPRMYDREIVISEDVTDEQIYSFHQYGHCLLSVSHGEAWSIPTFDAMGFGSFVITSDYGGPKEFVKSRESGIRVDGTMSICECSDAAFPHIFTGREYWFSPSEEGLRKAMREAFERYKENPMSFAQSVGKSGMETINQFTYEKIGQKMKGLLEVGNE